MGMLGAPWRGGSRHADEGAVGDGARDLTGRRRTEDPRGMFPGGLSVRGQVLGTLAPPARVVISARREPGTGLAVGQEVARSVRTVSDDPLAPPR